MTSPTISEKEITVSTQARTVATTLREGAAVAKKKGQAVGLPPEDADKLAELLDRLAAVAEGDSW